MNFFVDLTNSGSCEALFQTLYKFSNAERMFGRGGQLDVFKGFVQEPNSTLLEEMATDPMENSDSSISGVTECPINKERWDKIPEAG